MKKYKISEILIIITAVFTVTMLNLWHILYAYIYKPVNSVFIGISHYHEDYFYYISQVTQSMLGSWKTENLFSTDLIPKTFLWWPNILIGKISSLLHLYPWDGYTLILIITTIMSLITYFWAAGKIFPNSRLLSISTFLIAIFSSQFYRIRKLPDGIWQINPIDYFYSYTKALNRLGGVVHLMLQNILTLIIIVKSAEILEQIFHKHTSIKKLTLSISIVSVSFFCLMFINPMYVVIDAIVIAVSVIFLFIVNPRKISSLGKIIYTTVFTGVPLIIPSVIIFNTFNHPFYLYFRWAENQVRPTTLQVFLPSLGLILPFIIIGIIPYLKNTGIVKLLGLLWAIFQIIIYLTPIPNRLLVPYFRIHQPPAYVFLAAVAISGIYFLSSLVSNIVKRNVTKNIFIIILLCFLVFQIPMLYFEVDDRLHNPALNTFLNYPSTDLIDGLMTLKSESHEKYAMSINNLEFLIPVVSGLKVYAAHKSLTFNYNYKIALVSQFFNGLLSEEEARNFLSLNNIGYILWNKSDGDNPKFKTSYSFLKLLFENKALLIYTVNNI